MGLFSRKNNTPEKKSKDFPKEKLSPIALDHFVLRYLSSDAIPKDAYTLSKPLEKDIRLSDGTVLKAGTTVVPFNPKKAILERR